MFVLASPAVQAGRKSAPQRPEEQHHGYGEQEHGDVPARCLSQEHGEDEGQGNRIHEESAETVKATAPDKYPRKKIRESVPQFYDHPPSS